MSRNVLRALIGLVAVIFLMALGTNANAACKKATGLYTGAGNGFWFDTSTGNTVDGGVIVLSINVFANGSVSATEQGKSFSAGLYSRTWTVASVDNLFSTATCQGTVVNSLGQRFTYAVSNSGKVITFIYTTNDNNIAMYSFRLEKA
jgi:hypothetical protein